VAEELVRVLLPGRAEFGVPAPDERLEGLRLDGAAAVGRLNDGLQPAAGHDRERVEADRGAGRPRWRLGGVAAHERGADLGELGEEVGAGVGGRSAEEALGGGGGRVARLQLGERPEHLEHARHVAAVAQVLEA
jgi:hypothetical protein